MSKIKLLCIVPISSSDMTKDLRAMYPSTKSLDIRFLDGFGLAQCPPCIENHEQAIDSTEAILSRVMRAIRSESFDGILVCCFSDHPLVYELRKRCPIRVIGIFEAAIEDATSHAGNFGIVTTAMSWEPILTQSVRELRYEARCAGIRATGLGVLDLTTLPRKQVIDIIMCNIQLLRERGATNIILGCAGMARMEDTIRALLPSEACLFDGVRSGLTLLKKTAIEPGLVHLRDERL